eukprot:scaffold6526_cov19-Tisochrysis_lutea.AAC.2
MMASVWSLADGAQRITAIPVSLLPHLQHPRPPISPPRSPPRTDISPLASPPGGDGKKWNTTIPACLLAHLQLPRAPLSHLGPRPAQIAAPLPAPRVAAESRLLGCCPQGLVHPWLRRSCIQCSNAGSLLRQLDSCGAEGRAKQGCFYTFAPELESHTGLQYGAEVPTPHRAAI